MTKHKFSGLSKKDSSTRILVVQKYLSNYGIAFFLIISFPCCNTAGVDSQHTSIYASVASGKRLAAIYCQTCHQLPDPALIDKKTWVKNVLPGMGPRLGIFVFKGHEYPSKVLDRNIGRGFYPSKAAMDDGQWQDIINYYWANAPDTLEAIHRTGKIKEDSSLFQVLIPSAKITVASTTMVKIKLSEHGNNSNLYIGTVVHPGIYKYGRNLCLINSINTRGPVVDIQDDVRGDSHTGMTVCDIGYLNPNDSKLGSVERINYKESGSVSETNLTYIFDSLARPVQILSADLNQDHKMDYLICEFGNLKGQLAWKENLGNDKFSTHLLRLTPGAIRAYITDFNHDGLPDIICLFAQGDECIILYTNRGNGQFEEKKLLQFPAVYGSTYFELDDFNQDGYLDILYTCGDNADYSPIQKPYHGLYIFLNDGTNQFHQKYFFPMHGCFKAMARDFDGDGDLDIAAISFFPDSKKSSDENFFYLQNTGGFHFQPYCIPATKGGRWLTMDVGDIFGSGRPDIILGNFKLGILSSSDSSQLTFQQPFIVLKNEMK